MSEGRRHGNRQSDEHRSISTRILPFSHSPPPLTLMSGSLSPPMMPDDRPYMAPPPQEVRIAEVFKVRRAPALAGWAEMAETS